MSKLLKRLSQGLGIALVSIIVAALVGELIVRVKGYQPYAPYAFGLQSFEPANYVEKDSLLGFRIHEGTYKISYQNGFSYHVTHNQDQSRISSLEQPDSLAALAIYGCSFAYGQGVADSSTFAWKLQEALPQYQLENWAVAGYGTLQMYLLLQENIEAGRVPELVVLTYASFHDERNVFNRKFRKNVFPSSGDVILDTQFPFARIAEKDSSLVIQHANFGYRPWPLMRYSALIHLLEQSYNQWEHQALQSHQVSGKLLLKIAELCQKNQSALIVAGLIGDPLTQETLAFCEEHGIQTADISIDLSKPEYNLLPNDNHPSEKAHTQYASKLLDALNSLGITSKTDDTTYIQRP